MERAPKVGKPASEHTGNVKKSLERAMSDHSMWNQIAHQGNKNADVDLPQQTRSTAAGGEAAAAGSDAAAAGGDSTAAGGDVATAGGNDAATGGDTTATGGDTAAGAGDGTASEDTGNVKKSLERAMSDHSMWNQIAHQGNKNADVDLPRQTRSTLAKKGDK